MNKDDFQQLPTIDRNSTLQRKSIAKFQAILIEFAEDKFIFRDERIEDYGIDGSLEIQINKGKIDYGKATNFRVPLQLKSTDSEESN